MRVTVNPKKGYIAFDHIGRTIEWKKEGTEVTLNTSVSRQIKAGDLIKLEAETTKEIKKVEKKPVTEETKEE